MTPDTVTVEPTEIETLKSSEEVELTPEKQAEFLGKLGELMGGQPNAKDDPLTSLMQRVGYTIELQFDPVSRTIYILDDITDDLVKRVLPQLTILDETPGEINVVVMSCGGDIMAGLALHAAFCATKNPIIVTGIGNVYSMAAILLQAGDVRILDEAARVLIHSGASSFAGETRANLEHAAELEKMLSVIQGIVSRRTGLGQKETKELFARESYLSPKECKKLNLVDKIRRPGKKRKV